MEVNAFRFRISFVWQSDVDLWIEIPMSLYQKICDSVGKSKMERFEFGFKFSEIIKEKFPELDAQIHREIDKWKSEHYGINAPDHVLHMYGLTSSWFDEE